MSTHVTPTRRDVLKAAAATAATAALTGAGVAHAAPEDVPEGILAISFEELDFPDYLPPDQRDPDEPEVLGGKPLTKAAPV